MKYIATVFTFSECVESDQSIPAYGTKGPGLTYEDLKKIQNAGLSRKASRIEPGWLNERGGQSKT